MAMTMTTVLSTRQHVDINEKYYIKQQTFRATDTARHDDGKVEVLLPDMFRLFLSEPPRVNPHYELTKIESEAWFAEKCHLNARHRDILNRTDFSYFCAVTAPDAGPLELRTMCDWGNWVFPFDDLFDNGSLKDDLYEAQKVMDVVLSDMGIRREKGDMKSSSTDRSQLSPELQALVDVHQSVWKRIAASSSLGVQRRFANAMLEYFKGSIEQVSFRSQRRCPSFDELFSLRRKSAGVTPLFSLAEYALKLDLADEVFESKAIREIQNIGVDLVVVHNDILSYCKEEAEGVLHNLVAIARYQMQSSNIRHPQAAFDRVGALIADLYKRWFLALADLPSWGEKVDADVQKYIASVRGVVLANLNWSFRSERYFGKHVASVRSKRIVRVLKKLPVAL